MVLSILSLLDFSSCSQASLVQASRLSRSLEVPLHVLHVLDGYVAKDLASWLHEDVESVQRRAVHDAEVAVEEALVRVGERGRAQVHVVVGPRIDEVRKAVERLVVDLIVMGAYGDAGTGRGPGTLASQCVRKAPADVLLVPEDRTGPFEHIVACVDFSEVSRRVTDEAARLSRSDGAELTLLHVFEGPWRRLHYMAPTTQASPDFKHQYCRLLQSRLQNFADEQAITGAKTALFEWSGHGTGIVEFARRQNADLVVIGTKGSTNLRYMLLGSTAERVVRETPCAVLALKPLTPAGQP